MAQKTTYSVARETEADRIAEAERAKEKARIQEAERRDTLRATLDAETDRIAVDIISKRMQEGDEPVTIEVATEERLAQQEADEALYETILAREERKLEMFYRAAKTATKAALEYVELSDEMRVVCSRLGKPNAIRAGVMGVADGTGVITDPIRHTDEVWGRFVKLYRAESGIIDMDVWESLP